MEAGSEVAFGAKRFPEIRTSPVTENFAPGVVVPTPTLPLSPTNIVEVASEKLLVPPLKIKPSFKAAETGPVTDKLVKKPLVTVA